MEENMKHLVMIAAIGAALISTPALAGGKNGLNVGAVLTTGKGGLVGTLLGGNGHGSTGIATNVSVTSGKSGVLGLLLGNSSSGHGGYGGSHHGGW
jgi:hypothetical protein